jgi:hypothetical protein
MLFLNLVESDAKFFLSILVQLDFFRPGLTGGHVVDLRLVRRRPSLPHNLNLWLAEHVLQL